MAHTGSKHGIAAIHQIAANEMNALIIHCFVPSEEASDPAAPQRRAKERRYSTMPKSSITAVALVAFLAGALSPSADAFVPRQMSVARSAATSFMSTKENEIVGISEPSVTSESTANEAIAMGGENNVVGTDLSAMGQPNERYKAISLQAIDKVAEDHPQLKPHLRDVKLAGLVFPFKASPYYVDELVDWEADDVTQDPFYKLVFPTLDMLSDEHREKLEAAHDAGDPANLIKVVGEIREDLNPHPAGQKTLNAPKDGDDLNGVQHKYSETVLVFPAAAQTCHAYCTYCFRWAQFIGDDELRFAQKEATSLFNYLAKHEEVSDILMTGGDPMIMKTKSLAQYLEPLLDPDFLPHIKNLRIGTRSLSFWPQRFTTDKDADELITLLRRVRDEGKRHVAVMAHLSHERELSTDKVQTAIKRIQEEACATIRSQSPIMRGINDSAEVWANKWRMEANLGIIPYYMFLARDTGAQEYFNVPLVKAQRFYADAIRNTSGLIRTARGPSMSCTPGKVEVTGVEEIMGQKAFVLRFLQCRDENWIGRVFFAKYDEKAYWFDDLEPLDGMELPWDEDGLPKPVPDAIYQG